MFLAGDDAEDQTPFRYELLAINGVLQAMPRVRGIVTAGSPS